MTSVSGRLFIADKKKPAGRGLIITKNSIEKHLSIDLLSQIIVKGSENFSHQDGMVSNISGKKTAQWRAAGLAGRRMIRKKLQVLYA